MRILTRTAAVLAVASLAAAWLAGQILGGLTDIDTTAGGLW